MQKQDKDDNSYIPVQVLIDNRDYRTLEEQKSNPYPENIQLLCYGGKLIEDNDNDDEKLPKKEGIKTIDGRSGFRGNRDELDNYDYKFPCDILEKDKNRKQYEVQINFEERSVKVRNYPEESILITPKGYTSDQHLEGAFRHFMEIDDDIFPSHWKVL